MNFYRIFDKIFILLLVVFSISCSTTPIDAEKHVLTPFPGVKYSTEKTPVAEVPAIISPTVKTNHNTLGCVLPLSGQYAGLGNKARDAILLATELFDENNKPLWKVIVEDSRGLTEGTKAAIAHLANEENVMAIIAVTGTAEAMDAAREADQWKVPLILITPKEGVTSVGEYVFQNFLTPTQQIRALVQYTFDDLNYAIFAVLYPEDDYGGEMVKIFREEVTRIGGKVEKAIPYSRNQTDFKEEIGKLTGVTLNAPQKKRSDQAENKTTISVNFEVLFIPDSASRVKLITSQLDYYNVKGFQLLGTSLWHSPDLLKNGTEYLDDAIFADSFFTNSFYPKTTNFVDFYYTKYKREPENIEALAYDTANIIIGVLDDMEINTREQFIAALKKMEIYDGVTGKIYFDSDRVAQKTAFILKVTKGKLEQVK